MKFSRIAYSMITIQKIFYYISLKPVIIILLFLQVPLAYKNYYYKTIFFKEKITFKNKYRIKKKKTVISTNCYKTFLCMLVGMYVSFFRTQIESPFFFFFLWIRYSYILKIILAVKIHFRIENSINESILKLH